MSTTADAIIAEYRSDGQRNIICPIYKQVGNRKLAASGAKGFVEFLCNNVWAHDDSI